MTRGNRTQETGNSRENAVFCVLLYKMNQQIQNITDNIKHFLQKANKTKAVLGLSGGVDSALVAKLAIMALGKENVMALIMPNNALNHDQHVTDAETWAKELDIEYHIIAIDEFIGPFDDLPWQGSDLANMNVQARVRANILYHYANSNDALVLGTGNKTELTLGYFTKYGDGACDCEVIGSLYKTDVWAIGKELGLLEAILSKKPSATLVDGQTDEGEIGMSYSEMDDILKKFESGKKPETENELKLYKRMQATLHKTIPPAVL